MGRRADLVRGAHLRADLNLFLNWWEGYRDRLVSADERHLILGPETVTLQEAKGWTDLLEICHP